MSEPSGIVHLAAGRTSLVLAASQGERPRLLYWGERLDASRLETIEAMLQRQHAPGSADTEVEGSLLNELGTGVFGTSGFLAHRDGRDWAAVFRTTLVKQPTASHVVIDCVDDQAGMRATHSFEIDSVSEVVRIATSIENMGQQPLTIDWCASACLPVDQRLSRMFGFSGRWANEFQLEEISQFRGSYVRENKTGRTSHDSFPALLFGTSATSEDHGLCFGLHLGWSGNHRVRVDRSSDGRSFFSAGELFFPGEMQIAPGETYQTPALYGAVSTSGFSALSQQFHRFVRNRTPLVQTLKTPRPVHYNTWEAVYFDHDPQTLMALAGKAADVGAERFVMDDGWFGGRRHDRAGLGDWWPSLDVYPDGLAPIIARVNDLGMEFGLWFEPEMVNPDSDLFRKHPGWILQVEGVDQVPFRGQYVLDLTRAEVHEYVFERLDKLLSEHQIAYIKWDMNRDVHHPGSAGRAVGHRQVHAVYELIDRLRVAHPTVEIETCASGGGRADFGILERTDRIWTSDSNDALDRQVIQRGASYFFPLAVLGAHVGPGKCHITGRRLSMALRVATAMFGHMGMELNLFDEAEKDLEILKAGIALHKRHRQLIHQGDFYRVESPEHVNAVGCVAPDQTSALFSWCNLTGHRETLPGRFHVPGLAPEQSYRVRIVWPDGARSVSQPSVIDALDLTGQGTILSGELLFKVGLQQPLLRPETALIYHFEAVETPKM